MIFKYKVIVALLIGLCIADAALWISIGHDTARADSPQLYFLNVGQGDSELIILPGNIKILIDGGPTGAVLDALAEVLPPTDRSIDILMMTHPQLDHFGGFIDVLENYRVGVFVSNGRRADIAAYRGLHEALVAHQVPYIQLMEGDAIQIGDSSFNILSPSPQESLSGELNDTSVVALLTTPEFTALYTGDIGANVEERLVRDYDIDVDILKVGHHGSRFSSSKAFLDEVTPAISIIEVGKNTYGHPTPQTLSRLGASASEIFRTDTQGIVKVIFQNGQFQVLGTQ